jgi:hypothetical protein
MTALTAFPGLFIESTVPDFDDKYVIFGKPGPSAATT